MKSYSISYKNLNENSIKKKPNPLESKTSIYAHMKKKDLFIDNKLCNL